MFASALTGLGRIAYRIYVPVRHGNLARLIRGGSDVAPAKSLQALEDSSPDRTRQGLNHSESGLLADNFKEKTMSLGTILLIVLILMLIGVIPTWPHSRSWGYWPSGALGVVVLIIIILLVMGRL